MSGLPATIFRWAPRRNRSSGATATRSFARLWWSAAELHQCRPALLFAHSVRHEFRRLFFRAFARVNKGGTPTLALLREHAGARVLFVLGSFERVIAMLSFFFVANYTLTYTSVFVLRRKEPGHATAVSRMGLSVDHGHRAARLDPVFGGIDTHGPRDAPLALGMLGGLSYPVFRVSKWATARSVAG